MFRFLQKKPVLIVIIVVIIIAIIAFATSVDSGMTWAESAAGTIVSPVQSLASTVSNGVSGFFQRLFKTGATEEENEQLQMTVIQLQEQLKQMNEIQAENERLRDLLNYVDSNPSLECISGSVIGTSQGVWFDLFTINLGRSDGVAVNMPVINSEGIVGYISDVGANWSKVTAIIDTASTASVMVERTRDNGMVRGRFSLDNASANLELYYLPSDADLAPGDIILSNGLGGMYPKGLNIGTVVEVSRSGDSEYNALVETAVDFRHLEEIAVITNMPNQNGTVISASQPGTGE